MGEGRFWVKKARKRVKVERSEEENVLDFYLLVGSP